MILFPLLAAAFTFTATATGVEKGTAVEFVFAGSNSDRDYESMFLIDGSVDDFCRKLEKAGFPRGKPVEQDMCRLWPVGCRIEITPAVSNFVSGTMSPFVYTGGSRDAFGKCEAGDTMPASLFSTYSLAQSPIVPVELLDQGSAYGHYTAARKIEKGTRVEFTVSCDENTMPKALHLTIRPGNAKDVLERLRKGSEAGELDVRIDFDGALTVEEATAVSQALASIDSSRVKLNGTDTIFYRAFLPLTKWTDRQERLQQPFELTLAADGSNQLLFIEEDWSVEGDDPKLTPREISFEDARKYEKTDTCFIFIGKKEPLSRILSAMAKFGGMKIKNWYVFQR